MSTPGFWHNCLMTVARLAPHCRTIVSALLLSLGVSTVQAAAKPDDIHRLSLDLTPVGAERSGNASGTIPDWTGGLSTPPENYKAGNYHPDPFAAEAPRFRIDRNNYSEYQQNLGAGQLAMLRRYESWFIEVFPTHRSSALPSRVYQKTAENGRTGQLSSNGEAVLNVAEGLPFPFPENAQELIWNHRLRYKGTGSRRHISLVAPSPGGAFSEVTMTVDTLGLYYQPESTLESIDNRLLYFLQQTDAPARLAGSALLVYESLNPIEQPRTAWVYNPGQRRVIRAPNVAYDNSTAATDGLHVSDMTDMFNGALDRFEWELAGKREMFVPYNAYRVHSDELDYGDLVLPGHIDPQYLRYELHRVWVVEARLKAGQRHINPRRTYYLDEDSYQILMTDHYDSRGGLWRYSEAHPIVYYEVPTLWTTIEIHHDLQSGRFVSYRLNPRMPVPAFNMKMSPNEFTPLSLRRKGIR
jgi:hypothetical protein